MDKPTLRRYIRALKREHENELAELSRQTVAAIAAGDSWRLSRAVLLYSPLPDEVDVSPLFSCGKRVYLPRVHGLDLDIVPLGGGLAPGAFGILEPQGEAVGGADIDLVLVPGLAFDAAGHRLGRGRGYYDRLLPRLSGARRLGVCFPFQLLPEVPHEPHDVRMDEVNARVEPPQRPR